MMDTGKRDDGTQNGPGEQIRPQDGRENEDLDNLRGGADPSGGRSSEVPRDNSKAGPGVDDQSGDRDTAPLSPHGDGRPTEDDLARQDKTAPADGGDK